MERHFFNFHLTQADEFYEGKITVNQQLCFLYLLNPPKYRFNYSLVQIDRSYNVLSVLQEFESVNPWVKFKIKPEFSTTSRVALKLNICDSINGMEGEMFKVIDN